MPDGKDRHGLSSHSFLVQHPNGAPALPFEMFPFLTPCCRSLGPSAPRPPAHKPCPMSLEPSLPPRSDRDPSFFLSTFPVRARPGRPAPCCALPALPFFFARSLFFLPLFPSLLTIFLPFTVNPRPLVLWLHRLSLLHPLLFSCFPLYSPRFFYVLTTVVP